MVWLTCFQLELEAARAELERSILHDNGILFHLCQQRRDILKNVPVDIKVFHESMVRLLQEESLLLEKIYFGRCVKAKTATVVAAGSSASSSSSGGGGASRPSQVSQKL